MMVPLSIVVFVTSGGIAQAAYEIDGSDTLTQVINDAIAASGANRVHRGVGSGQGERDLALGCLNGAITGGNFQEGIAPMSRNLQQALLNACPWYPGSNQVLGLDAVVFFRGPGPDARRT
jgi:hypothetical protein